MIWLTSSWALLETLLVSEVCGGMAMPLQARDLKILNSNNGYVRCITSRTLRCFNKLINRNLLLEVNG